MTDRPILAAMLSCSGAELTDFEKKIFSKYNPLGISLFARNIVDENQLKQLINQIKNAINREDVLIAIDEEGGRVSRLKPILKHGMVSAEDLGNSSIKYSQIHAILISEKMKKLGININYAPIVETISKNLSKVLESRCFSVSSRKTMSRALAMAESYIKEGICPCLKHIPGHFSAMQDPHLSVLEADQSITDIKKEISYLKKIETYPLAMTSHIKLNTIDKNNPVSMSKKCILEIVRGYLKFDNFLMSDAIDMHALSGNIADRTNGCLDAGLDAVCYCAGRENEIYDICAQKRFLTEKSLIRFANIKKVIHNKANRKDISTLENLYMKEFQHRLNVEYSYDATEVLNKMLEKGERL